MVTKEIPKLLLVKSDAIRCNGCKRWIGRLPQWDNADLGKGFQCEHCGCTSVIIKEGRPFGPRHRNWQTLVEEFSEYARLGMFDDEWIRDTVVTAA